MTSTFATDADNDIFLGNDGNLVIDTGIQAIADACKTATQAQLGEMVLEVAQGIPTFQTVWIGTPNYAQFESYLRNTLSAVVGVQEVQSLELTAQNNVLNYVATIKTQFGTVTVNG